MNNEHELLHLNFLPSERSKAASRIVRLHELSLLGMALGLMLLTMFLILASSLVFLNSRLDTLLTIYSERQQLTQAAQKDITSGSILFQKTNLNVIQNQIAARFSVDPYIVGIGLAVLNTPSVDLASLKIETSKGTIRISGQANTRDGFLAFMKALKEIQGVKEVVYPPGVVFAIEPIVFDVTMQL